MKQVLSSFLIFDIRSYNSLTFRISKYFLFGSLESNNVLTFLSEYERMTRQANKKLFEADDKNSKKASLPCSQLNFYGVPDHFGTLYIKG